jgi:hypothetical protein
VPSGDRGARHPRGSGRGRRAAVSALGHQPGRGPRPRHRRRTGGAALAHLSRVSSTPADPSALRRSGGEPARSAAAGGPGDTHGRRRLGRRQGHPRLARGGAGRRAPLGRSCPDGHPAVAGGAGGGVLRAGVAPRRLRDPGVSGASRRAGVDRRHRRHPRAADGTLGVAHRADDHCASLALGEVRGGRGSPRRGRAVARVEHATGDRSRGASPAGSSSRPSRSSSATTCSTGV